LITIRLSELLDLHVWPLLRRYEFVVLEDEAYKRNKLSDSAVIKFREDQPYPAFYAAMGVIVLDASDMTEDRRNRLHSGRPILGTAQFYFDLMPPERSRWYAPPNEQRWSLETADGGSTVDDLMSIVTASAIPLVERLLAGRREVSLEDHPGLRVKRVKSPFTLISS